MLFFKWNKRYTIFSGPDVKTDARPIAVLIFEKARLHRKSNVHRGPIYLRFYFILIRVESFYCRTTEPL